MSSPYQRHADSVLLGMCDYLEGFTQYHSDLMYNYYKEKVFTISYEQILQRLSALYKIDKVFFNQEKLNYVLTLIHKNYKEFETFYLKQRDLEADMSRVTQDELDRIELNLEKYTAAFIRHLTDMKIGFNLFLVAETQRKFFKEHNAYDLSAINPDAKPAIAMNTQPQPQDQPEEDIRMTITNVEAAPSTNMPRMDPNEFMVHLTNLRNMANNYFSTNLKPGTKYFLEMKLTFPHS
jgi:hypothetical protein